ncbi:Peptide-methionine (R)-S-oxide reductase [Aphelenchoides besseyi]|nr:Peptide-methionine (R)-S-oxide reductase [Aphelenchoides besseyi]
MSSTKKDESTSKLDKPAKEVTDEEWRKMLPDEVYHVAREAGTERPHTSKFVKHFTPGKYNCYCCGAELFVSDAKFWTSCGWPSFSKSVEGDKNIFAASSATPISATSFRTKELRQPKNATASTAALWTSFRRRKIDRKLLIGQRKKIPAFVAIIPTK